jgi:hypothetical protein
VDIANEREPELFKRAEIPIDRLAADVEADRELLHVQALPILQSLEQPKEPNDLPAASHRSVLATSLLWTGSLRAEGRAPEARAIHSIFLQSRVSRRNLGRFKML